MQLFLPTLRAADSNALSDRLLLNANFMERDNEKDITILRENVQVIMEQNYISCNEAVVVWSKNEVVAVGDVLLRNTNSDIHADKLVYNFKTKKAEIFNGVITSGQMLLQSDEINKVGPDTYVAENAYFTSCTTCPASWSFTAKKVRARMEGYAFISNTWLRFLEVPSIYLPYLVVPLKNERQTGFLPPTMQFGNERGLSIEIPFFWAISRNQDMTLALRYYSKSGPQLLTNYRYVLSPRSSGELHYGILRDQHLEDGQFQLYKKNRWHMSYSHHYELPNNYVQRVQLLLTSDLNYTEDFPQLFNFRGRFALDNRVSLTKYNKDYSLSFDSSYYVGLLEPRLDESKASSVHRIPEINFTLADRRLSDSFPLFLKLQSQYLHLVRRGIGFDTLTPQIDSQGNQIYSPTSATGLFDSTVDKVRTGQRWDTQAELYTPFRFY